MISMHTFHFLILTLFIPFSVTGICLSYFVRVDGRPLLAAVAMTVGAIVNISLDWLFVVKLHWGIQGAAFATGFSQITLLCMLFSHFLQKKGINNGHRKEDEKQKNS